MTMMKSGHPAPPTQRQRENWLALAGEHVPLLYRFVRHEIAYLEALGELEPGALTAEDVVDAMLLRVQAELPKAPAEPPTRAAA